MTRLGDDFRQRSAESTDVSAHMAVFYAWARSAATIIELGVRAGYSTCAFLAGLERGPGELWSVDITLPAVPDYFHQLQFWHLFVGDDQIPEAVAFCPHDADVLFIDTSHFFDHTLAELRLYAPKVRKGGVILMHDTGPGEWPEVAQALDAYCAETGLSWYNHPVWPGLGVVEVPGA